MSPTFVTRVKVLFIDNLFHIVAICRFVIENPTLLSNGMLLGTLVIVVMLLAHEVGHLYAPPKFWNKSWNPIPCSQLASMNDYFFYRT